MGDFMRVDHESLGEQPRPDARHRHCAMCSRVATTPPCMASFALRPLRRDARPQPPRVPADPNRTPRSASIVFAKKGKKSGGGTSTPTRPSSVEFVTVSEDGSDEWRLGEIANMLRDGAVGIIPTDTKYALVCDLESRTGVQTLYDLKGASSSKPMSILCKGFSDIDKYTQGFPDNVVPGRTQAFKLAKKCLPGPYTFVLNAGKDLPKLCLQDPKTKSKNCKTRRTVGVRISGNRVTMALLERLDRPLLSTTAPSHGPSRGNDRARETDDDDEIQDPAVMSDSFGESLAFVVDCGVLRNPPSTVIDLSGAAPKLIRKGAGDIALWVEDEQMGGWDEQGADDEDAWGW